MARASNPSPAGAPRPRHVMLCVTGSIAAYKAADVVSALRKEGHTVTVAMTASATRLVTPLTFETLSHRKVITDLFTDDELHRPDHVNARHVADLVAVIPATANVLSKAACGIADDAVTTLLITVQCPLLFAPAMNTAMWENPVIRRNVQTLRDLGHHFIMPTDGELACGDVGYGKLAPVEEILQVLRSLLAKPHAKRAR